MESGGRCLVDIQNPEVIEKVSKYETKLTRRLNQGKYELRDHGNFGSSAVSDANSACESVNSDRPKHLALSRCSG
ncbi:hypothetical protein THI_1446 [Thiomonas arsenitoxydans]|nr:hypothetical protein THI_1446 [Thiomonas arsenitoxydans]